MKKLTTEEFIKKAKSIHGNLYDYSKVDYQNSITKIEIVCKKHGSFFQKPNGHLSGWACRKCGRDTVAKKFARSKEEFIEKAKSIHGNLYDYSKVDYINDSSKVEIICQIHGSFFMNGSNHLSGKQGCRSCNMKKSIKATEWLLSIPLMEDCFEKRVELNDGTWIIADAYDKTNQTIYEYWGDYWHGNPIVYDKDYWNPHTKKTMGELFLTTQEKRKRIISSGYKLVEKWETEK